MHKATKASAKQHERSRVGAAMREVHRNVPRNVKATGKTGAAKEAMLRAIAMSKARRGR